jgi:hypothetical protein
MVLRIIHYVLIKYIYDPQEKYVTSWFGFSEAWYFLCIYLLMHYWNMVYVLNPQNTTVKHPREM